jgi:hypothetical protein
VRPVRNRHAGQLPAIGLRQWAIANDIPDSHMPPNFSAV